MSCAPLRHVAGAVSLAVILSLSAAPAGAGIVAVDGSGTGLLSQSAGPAAAPVSVTDSDGVTTVNYLAAADPSGVFRVRAQGGGDFTAQAHTLFSQTVTNSSGGAQGYSFTFTVDAGELDTILSPFTPPPPGGGVSSAFALTIKLNGATIWAASADLEKTALGSAALMLGGTDIGGVLTDFTPQFSAYQWGAYTDTLALGTFADGASFTLDYEMTVGAVGVLGPGSTYREGEATARIGDPAAIGSAPGFGITGGAATAVPAAPAGTLLAGGLGLLAFLRRRAAA